MLQQMSLVIHQQSSSQGSTPVESNFLAVNRIFKLLQLLVYDCSLNSDFSDADHPSTWKQWVAQTLRLSHFMPGSHLTS